MSNYILNIKFTDEQLDFINKTNTKVIIAKPTSQEGPSIAWQAFKPMQFNRLSWEEKYGIYVSTGQLEHGAYLTKLSKTSVGAVDGRLYTLKPSGVISGPDGDGVNNAYALQNNYENNFMTVGLYQDAKLNGIDVLGNVVSAAPVLQASTAIMTPYTTVYIWLQSDVESNTVVTTVKSKKTELKFGGDLNTFSVIYDSKSGEFDPVM
ncbi:MAG: hypothetical protein ACT6QS_08030 [Flavobacteriales bacterium]